MMGWLNIFADGFEFSFMVSIAIVAIVITDPRLLLHRMPDEVQEKLQPKTNLEVKKTIIVGIGMKIFVFLYLMRFLEKFSYIDNFIARYIVCFVYSFLVLLYFCIWDFIVFDCVGFFILEKLNWTFYKGINPSLFRNYHFHLKRCVVGMRNSVKFSLVSALISTVIFHFD